MIDMLNGQAQHTDGLGISMRVIWRISKNVQLEFKWQDLWIGVYPRRSRPDRTRGRFDIWITIPPFGLPMLPLHIWQEW